REPSDSGRQAGRRSERDSLKFNSSQTVFDSPPAAGVSYCSYGHRSFAAGRESDFSTSTAAFAANERERDLSMRGIIGIFIVGIVACVGAVMMMKKSAAEDSVAIA